MISKILNSIWAVIKIIANILWWGMVLLFLPFGIGALVLGLYILFNGFIVIGLVSIFPFLLVAIVYLIKNS